MAISRGNSLLMKKQWAEDGSTVIPNPPVAGTTYRDESVDADNIAEGQEYDGVADSARWNQLLYIITGILKDTLAHGVLPWINTQDYSEGAVVMGSNGTLYIAKKANGPTVKNAKNPTTDSAERVWKAVIRLNTATMALDSAGKILAKDVAIGGDASDLASGRGLFNSKILDSDVDLNTIKLQGIYNISSSAVNGPGFSGKMIVTSAGSANMPTQFVLANLGTKIAIRGGSPSSSWSDWIYVITEKNVGDGVKVTNGIISVPEYVGATSSKSGTAGLVPPATAAERDKFLKGDGTYDSIGEGVYVKKTGDTMSGGLRFSSVDLVSTEPWKGVSISDSTRPSTNTRMLAVVLDKDNKRFFGIEVASNADGSRLIQYSGRKRDDSTWIFPFQVSEAVDGSITGKLGNKNIVRSVNNAAADDNGNVTLNTMPVGAVYVQFASQPDPTSLFGGTWSNISSLFAGLFFRAEGGAAATFGGSQTGGLPNITGTAEISNSKIGSSVKNFSGALYGVGSYSRGVVASTDLEMQTNLGIDAKKSSAIYGAANEVRPVNSTIRIWKRTA